MKANFYSKLLLLSWKALQANPFRSFLTTLGIIIGASTIVIVVGLGEGAKRDIEAQYSNMSVTTIIVNGPSTETAPSKLSPDDIPAIAAIPTVTDVVPMLSGKVSVNTSNTAGSWTVVGTYSNLASVANLQLIKGTFFEQSAEEQHEKIAILGATVAEEMFGSREANAVGELITLGKKEFVVGGIIEYRGGSFGPVNIDESIFTPYSASYRYVLGKNGKFSFNVNASSIETLDSTMEALTLALRETHNLGPGSVDDFRLRDMGATVASATNSSKTMAILLSSVGLIVLIVGGIGIMNIMYVTVSERTREIGVRKAIGAKDEHILWQFLNEAFILTSTGYVVGIGVAFVVHWLLVGMGVKIVFVPWSLLLSLVVTYAIGIFFGYYPARKAASLDPIEALRYE